MLFNKKSVAEQIASNHVECQIIFYWSVHPSVPLSSLVLLWSFREKSRTSLKAWTFEECISLKIIVLFYCFAFYKTFFESSNFMLLFSSTTF